MKHRTPAFERLFAKAVRDYVLEDGRISPYEAAWLRHMLFADGTIHDGDRMLLRQLKEEAREVSPEFDALLHEVMRWPPQRTSVN